VKDADGQYDNDYTDHQGKLTQGFDFIQMFGGISLTGFLCSPADEQD